MNSFAINEHAKSPNKVTSSGGYAYFPGTGPSVRSCGECAFAAKIGQHTHCRKWSDLKKSTRRGPPIDRNSDSCKFFEMRGV